MLGCSDFGLGLRLLRRPLAQVSHLLLVHPAAVAVQQPGSAQDQPRGQARLQIGVRFDRIFGAMNFR